MTVGTRHPGAFFIAENGENAMFYQTEKFRNNPCVSFLLVGKPKASGVQRRIGKAVVFVELRDGD
ncbi:MAG: hypothetical protein II133_01985, partial [Lachnospiraceae bacterium]|nr:hypothetical protein [Lachnospiraceae bacterium]